MQSASHSIQNANCKDLFYVVCETKVSVLFIKDNIREVWYQYKVFNKILLIFWCDLKLFILTIVIISAASYSKIGFSMLNKLNVDLIVQN